MNALAHRFIFGNSFEITAVFAVASAAKLLSLASVPDPPLLGLLVGAVAKVAEPFEGTADAAAGAMTGGCGAAGGTLGVLTGSMGEPCRDRGCMNLSGFSGVGDPPAFASNLARPFATAPENTQKD